RAQMVGLPDFDELLDRFPIVQPLIEDFSRELGEFRVTGEAQRDELIDAEFLDAGLQICRKQTLIAKAFFEPDNAILYFEGHDARDCQSNDESGRDQHLEDRIGRISRRLQPEERPNEICQENRCCKKVEWWKEFGVV
ncbi:MAG: hypothetical protein JO260_05185, partial [Acidobacteria bacterium]|nr:hypothetical protein [Acidobacteriota bacterium]